MDLKEIFSNTFFTVIIAISAMIFVLIYMRILQYRLSRIFRRKFMEKQISELKDHFIICGFGRVGTQVAEELFHEKVPFVVADREPTRIQKCQEKGWLGILGDAAIGEEVLKKAQIERAKCLIIAIGQDADTVFVAVTAKSLNPNVYIVARASSTEVGSKLEKVGVERIALPYQIGGYHMANMALRPGVVDFLDVIVDSKHKEMVVEELNVDSNSKLVGEEIDNHFNRHKTSTVILAIKKPDQSCIINPTPNIILKDRDKLILLGTKEGIEKIRREYES